MKKLLTAITILLSLQMTVSAQEENIIIEDEKPVSQQVAVNNPLVRQKWTIGVKSPSIANLPNTIFMQRKLFNLLWYGMSLEYDNNPVSKGWQLYIPEIYSLGNYSIENIYSKDESSVSAWAAVFSPEITVDTYSRNTFTLSQGVRVEYACGHAKGTRTGNFYPSWSDTVVNVYTGWARFKSYGVSVPFIISKSFLVRKHEISLGVESTFIKAYCQKRWGETTRSGDDKYYSKYNDETPWKIRIVNPLQTNVNLIVKMYF